MPNIEKSVDKLIEDFNAWFQGLGNAPLANPEKAAIKTFCWYLLKMRTCLQLDKKATETEDGSISS